MAKTGSKKQGGKSILPSQGKMIAALIGVIAVAAVVFFLGNAILEAVGFGIFLLVLWFVVFAWIFWRQGLKSMTKWWNIWLGAILFSLAVWGIFALFHPQGLIIADADFAEVSLGGNAGKSFIGNQGAGAPPAARLAILLLCST